MNDFSELNHLGLRLSTWGFTLKYFSLFQVLTGQTQLTHFTVFSNIDINESLGFLFFALLNWGLIWNFYCSVYLHWSVSILLKIEILKIIVQYWNIYLSGKCDLLSEFSIIKWHFLWLTEWLDVRTGYFMIFYKILYEKLLYISRTILKVL